MSAPSCSKADCTIAATGKCLESHATPDECPFFLKDGEKVAEPTKGALSDGAIAALSHVDAPDDGRSFHAGMELGFEEALRLCRARYVHLVPILGATNAGKTCVLVSLYLLAVNRALNDFRFAGSQTLLGFEHRARGLRKWPTGALPAQFADHTILGDDRAPSFVHIAFDDCAASTVRQEFLFTDLPGEWTTGLINRAETATRFQFMSRADAIVIALDGTALANPVTRQHEVMQAENLLQRLAENLKVPKQSRLILLISKCDEVQGSALQYTTAISARAEQLGYELTVIETAAISREPNRVANGLGIPELLRAIVRPRTTPPSPGTARSDGRSISNFPRSRSRQ